MKKIVVQITPEESNLVEGAFTLYNASIDILKQILTYDNVKTEYLNDYFMTSEKYNLELEKVKKEISEKYAPAEFNNNYNYEFIFTNSTIIYTEKEL